MNNSHQISCIAALVSWNLQRFQGKYYTFNVHYSYLQFMSEHFNKVYLVSSVKNQDSSYQDIDPHYCVNQFNNVEVVVLPEVTSSAKALLRIRAYYKAIKLVAPHAELFYCRVPDPFSWMPALIGRRKTIMHFVGDTIDTTKYNEKWSTLKKTVMIAGYKPEWWLTLKAAKRSHVYCNGYHLVKRLSKFGIVACPVVSSTVSIKSFPDSLHQIPVDNSQVTILFLSYIRYAKGITCLIELICELENRHVPFHFNIIGDGEMMPELKGFVKDNGLSSKVEIMGHIKNRETINEVMHKCDLFFFSSLSEGSPRVIIEAASQGLPILSTPVGSLPYSFVDGESIRFFPFNDAKKAADIIQEFIKNPSVFVLQREKAYKLVKERYTIETFLSTVFNYEG